MPDPAAGSPAAGSPAAGSLAAGPTVLDPLTVLRLQTLRDDPCVSLLLTTTPGPRLADPDRVTLERLAAEAAARLRAEAPPALEQTLAVLDEAVSTAFERPVRHGLAVFASAYHSELVDLPMPVEDRSVVDPSFATRDLVRALHRTPRHVLLVLSGHEARLFDAAAGTLAPAAGAGFPLTAPVDRHGSRGGTEFLRAVDAALGGYLRAHPAPVVLAAAEPTASTFRGMSRHLGRLAGVIPGNHLRTPLPELAVRARPLLEQYLASREHEALELVATRQGQDRVVLGVDACWLASRWERPEMLAVEDGYRVPAALSDDGDTLTPVADPRAPGVLDDAVDELIEAVLSRGGWVAIVRDGSLPDGARVALTLRR
jgi:hypothetical protein